jgi:hypothetical protein
MPLTVDNLNMNAKYEIRIHADGYVVAAINTPVGISTHKDILDALAVCRVANRFARGSSTYGAM